MGETVNAEKAPKKSFVKGLKSEFKKIIWPDWQTVKKQTAAVLASAIAIGAVTAILDWLIIYGLKLVV